MDRRGGARRVAGTLWDYGHQCPLTARGASPVAPEKAHWLAEEECGGQGTSCGGSQVGGDNICTSMFCSNDFFEELKWYFQLAEVMATVNQEFIVWTLDLIKQAPIKFSGIIHNLDKLKTPHLQGAVNPLPWTPWPVAIPVYFPGGDDLSLQQQRAPRGREGRGWG